MIKVSDVVEIVNERGLHARASAKFVGMVAELPDDLEVCVSKDGAEAAGGSILGLMMLGAARGDKIEISVSGEGAEEALTMLADLVRGGFGEG
ncbi:MAG: HPr family phosphocarrier protein [Novosphingobium sp.]|nr:HPr family phosphocarrier protein [Novosphingobium sp.]MCP5402790.1 HPr family phosphocarrier protein [Novosphingobium sp.]